MDYGYRMLRHVVAQVFGNFRQAARLTLLLTFLPMGLLLVLFLSTGATLDPSMGQGDMPNPGMIFLLVLAGIVVSAITYCWAAVGWHRFVLLEEYGNGLVPRWHGGFVLSYIGRAILLGIVVFLIAFVSSLVLGGLLFALPGVVSLLVVTGWVLGMSWVITRLGLILPAAALGEPMSIGESWRATAPVATDLLVPLFIIALAMSVLGGLVNLMFQGSALGFIPQGLLYWIQILLNLSLMTTLYGTQVQGRTLN